MSFPTAFLAAWSTLRAISSKRFGSMKHAGGTEQSRVGLQIFRRRLDFNVCYGHFSSIAVGFVDCVAYRVVFFDDLAASRNLVNFRRLAPRPV